MLLKLVDGGVSSEYSFARDELQMQRPNRLAKGLNGEFRVRFNSNSGVVESPAGTELRRRLTHVLGKETREVHRVTKAEPICNLRNAVRRVSQISLRLD